MTKLEELMAVCDELEYNAVQSVSLNLIIFRKLLRLWAAFDKYENRLDDGENPDDMQMMLDYAECVESLADLDQQ